MEPPSTKSSKLYQILVGRSQKLEKYRLFDWEPLLDALFAFYDVCCGLEAQKRDKNVANFVRKYKSSIDEIRGLRVTKNDFEVLKTIGRGHFGEVYAVRENGSHDVYAMKILKKTSTLANDNIAFYEEERDIMAFANSPWVTSIQYAFQDVENLYLVMDFHPGGDLLTLLSKCEDGIMEEEDAKFYLSELIMAVRAVHLIGYVHRDVKPENILIDMTGHLKLADFGSSAKLVGKKSVFSKMPVGTPEYIAPEVLQSMNAGGGIYGCECDWWSVGVVSYEMMLGSLPFEADGVLQLYSQIMNFKNSLEFPEDVTLTPVAKSFVTGLLEDQKTRYGYNELAKHEFFVNMDWTTLTTVKPPFIPSLKDSADTSNFGDFKQNKCDSFKPSQPSLSNTLPFIGFTFTKGIYTAQKTDSKPRPSTSLHQHSITDDLTTSIDRGKDSSRLAEKLNVTVEALNKNLAERDEKCKKLERDVASMSDENKKKSQMIDDLNCQMDKLVTEKNELCSKIEGLIQDRTSTSLVQEQLDVLLVKYESEHKIVQELTSEKEWLKLKIEQITSENELNLKKYQDSETYWKEYEKIQHKTQNELKDAIKEFESLVDKTTTEYQEKLNNSFEETKKYRNLCEALEKKLGLSEQERKISYEQLTTRLVNEDQLNDIKDKLSESYKKCESLKETNNEMEDKVKDFENELNTKEIALVKLNQGLRCLENDVKQYQSKLREAEKLAETKNEEISNLKIQSDQNMASIAHYKNLAENNERALIESLDSLKQLTSKYEHDKKKLSDELSNLSKLTENIKCELALKTEIYASTQKKYSALENIYSERESAITKLQSEIDRMSSIVSAQKVSNYTLSKDLEEAKYKINNLESENEEINSNMERITTAHKEQIFKLNSTIAQQTKLINFLHTEKGKKKGKKDYKMEVETIQPTVGNVQVQMRKTRDVEHQLELERMQTLRLNNELLALKEELRILRGNNRNIKSSDRKHSVNVMGRNSMCLSISGSAHSVRESPLEGSASDIDDHGPVEKISNHNFVSSVCLIPNSCPLCLLPISFGKPVFQCADCRLVCHINCESFMPDFQCHTPINITVLIPNMHISLLHKVFVNFDVFKITLPYVGVLSVPHRIGKNAYEWRKRQVKLTTSELVITGELDDLNSKVFNIIRFKESKVPCILHPAVHTADIMFTPISNIPYVFGIETPIDGNDSFKISMSLLTKEQEDSNNNTCIYFLTQSLDEKRLWIRLLEYVDIEGRNSIESSPSDLKPDLSLKSETYHAINSIVSVDEEYMLIATSLNIYLCRGLNPELHPCLSKQVEVHQLMLKEGHLFGILGEQRKLVRFYIEKHTTIKKLSIKNYSMNYSSVSNLVNCYRIYQMEVQSDVAYIYLATLEEIIIAKVPKDPQNTKISRIVSVGIPTSLIHVNNSLYTSQDKFYSISLSENNRKELLDSNDHSLAFIKYGSSLDNNYPMAIFCLERNNKHEYLICCSEFGLLIDTKGKRISTGDLRWPQIPLSFHFSSPILYVLYQEFVEMWSFKTGSLTDLNLCTSLAHRLIRCPKFLGFSLNGSIYVSSVESDFSTSVYICNYKLSAANSSRVSVKSQPSSISASKTEQPHKGDKKKSFFRRNPKKA